MCRCSLLCHGVPDPAISSDPAANGFDIIYHERIISVRFFVLYGVQARASLIIRYYVGA